MLAVELIVSERGGSLVVALRGDLDVIGVPDTESAIAALMARGLLAQRGGRRCEHPQPPEAIRLAAARGEHHPPWEGSVVAYAHRMIAAGTAATRTGSWRGRMHR